MHGSLDDSDQLNRILANDARWFLPLDAPYVFSPESSWSGARFIRWRSDSGPMVLKIWQTDGPDHSAHRRRHLALQPLHDFEPVPALPVPDSAGHTLRILPDGRCAELFHWQEGDPVGQDPPGETIRQVMTTLARLHRIWSSDPGQRQDRSEAVQQRIRQLRGLESGGLEYAATEARHLRSSSSDIGEKLLSIIGLARQSLPAAIRTLEPLVSLRLPLQVVLRDTRPNHFLMKDDKLIGVIDFGAIGFDTVALDLARLFGEWHQLERSKRDLAYRAYESIRPLAPAEMAAVDPLITLAAILGGVAWVDIVCRRRLSEGREAASLAAMSHAENRLRMQVDKHLR